MGVIQGTLQILEDAEKNGGKVNPAKLKALSTNIRTMVDGVDKVVDKYQDENFQANCSVVSYLSYISSILRRNDIAAGG